MANGRLRIFILVGLVFFVGAVLLIHNMLTAPYPGHNDFMSRWEGARSFWIDGLNPYGEQASLNIQEQIYGRPVEAGEDPGYFAYPMYTAILVWPLVYMDYAWASAIWMVVLGACLLVSLFMLIDLFQWRVKPWLLGLLCIWVLFFYYSARGLILGQVGVVVYFLELLTLWSLVKKRDGLAGVVLALSTVKPQMGFLIVPFLLLWALRYRRWRFITWFVGAMVLLLGVSFVLLPSWLSDWLGQLGLYTSYTALGSPVWIITSYYLGLGNWAELLVAGLIGLTMLMSWYWLLKDRPEQFMWAAVLTLTVTHLIAPRTATPHYVVFIIPLIFYFAILVKHNRRRGNLWVALILLVSLVVPWIHFLLTVVDQFEHPSIYLPLPIIMFVLLWWTRELWWRFETNPALTRE
ncbi:MAG: DUF2029 domain-containing protein [Chloroflexi bacterium]|nr:DUF2029 domain-containing protein [Chloroflexota bacterium]